MTRTTWGVTGFAILFGLLTPAGASAQNGAALYREHCSGCHYTGADRAPARDALQTMSAERVLTALENGAMLSMGSRMSTADRRALAQAIIP
jgi:mono/diheme cytochrome c family protein